MSGQNPETVATVRPVTAPLAQRETETRLSPTGRVEAFSDGVMAIAITLLVLDLKLPGPVAEGGLLDALLNRWPTYVAYVAAFLTIGIIWLNHRTLVDRIARFDARLHWLNLMLLFGVATLPFPTSLVAEYLQHGGNDAKVATAFYGLCATLMAVPWGFIWRHLADRPDLLEPGYDSAYARAEWKRGTIGLPVYAAAALVAFAWPVLSLLLYLGIAILYAVTSQGLAVPKVVANRLG
jgi:uncharacterized membrane protein